MTTHTHHISQKNLKSQEDAEQIVYEHCRRKKKEMPMLPALNQTDNSVARARISNILEQCSKEIGDFQHALDELIWSLTSQEQFAFGLEEVFKPAPRVVKRVNTLVEMFG